MHLLKLMLFTCIQICIFCIILCCLTLKRGASICCIVKSAEDEIQINIAVWLPSFHIHIVMKANKNESKLLV